MTEIEFAALMVSRVCHDLVGPLGAVVNGLEVLEDERDAAMRGRRPQAGHHASANQALARIQFMRIAFGAAGSAGAELDLGEIGRLVTGLLEGGKVRLEWNVPQALLAQGLGQAADERHLAGAPIACRAAAGDGGSVRKPGRNARRSPAFRIHAAGLNARVTEEVDRSVKRRGAECRCPPGSSLSSPTSCRARSMPA